MKKQTETRQQRLFKDLALALTLCVAATAVVWLAAHMTRTDSANRVLLTIAGTVVLGALVVMGSFGLSRRSRG